jgi:hypothetical protein
MRLPWLAAEEYYRNRRLCSEAHFAFPLAGLKRNLGLSRVKIGGWLEPPQTHWA